MFTNFSDQTSTVEQSGQALLFRVQESPFAWGRSSDKPVCHAMVGIILECLRWASNGYEFYVREVSCTAAGANECVFKVNKTAIGEGGKI